MAETGRLSRGPYKVMWGADTNGRGFGEVEEAVLFAAKLLRTPEPDKGKAWVSICNRHSVLLRMDRPQGAEKPMGAS